MARPQLSALLEPRGNEDTVKVGDPVATPAQQLPVEPSVTSAPLTMPGQPPAKPATERRQKTPGRSLPPAPQKSADRSVPPYLRFERKEARLRTDQLTDLTLRARQLNKTKDADADRITDNTLIRIAVDLLLSRSDELSGGDETELRKSLGI